MADQVRDGGCGCGHVRFRAVGEPIFVNNCHCTQCQHQTGGTSVVNAFFESERITVTAGALTENTVKGGSGGPHVIVRCAECGVAVFSHYPRFGRLGAGVRVGAFDEPGAFRPDAIVHVAEKMPWVPLPEGIPAFAQYYNPKELLAPEKWERMVALMTKKAAQA
ncbi:MAG: GFA family protein [Sphingomonadales bacterium]|nr:GFA family protein [Sphingomonadales bacterium]